MQQRDTAVRADADREREDRGRAEDRIAPERAQAVAQIEEERLQPDEQVPLARGLAGERDAAEPPPRLPPRRVLRYTVGDQVIGPLAEVKFHLPIDLVGDTIGAKDIDQPNKPGHAPPFSACFAQAPPAANGALA